MIDSYIKVNAPTIARNCIVFLLTRGKPISVSLENTKEYESKYHYCDTEKLIDAAKTILNKCIYPAELAKLCRHDMQRFISPHYTNVSDYLKNVFETDLPLQEISAIIKNDIGA